MLLKNKYDIETADVMLNVNPQMEESVEQGEFIY